MSSYWLTVLLSKLLIAILFDFISFFRISKAIFGCTFPHVKKSKLTMPFSGKV